MTYLYVLICINVTHVNNSDPHLFLLSAHSLSFVSDMPNVYAWIYFNYCTLYVDFYPFIS